MSLRWACEWNVAPNPAAGRFIEEIEPRILYSADFAPASPRHAGSVSRDRGTHARQQRGVRRRVRRRAQPRRHELVFVDSRTPDSQALVDGLHGVRRSPDRRGAARPDADGIQQISEALAARSGLDAVHILSHGEAGAVQLGSTVFNFDSLIDNATQIRGWGERLRRAGRPADLWLRRRWLQEGRSLMDALARLTGADVAASDDPTGDAKQRRRLGSRVRRRADRNRCGCRPADPGPLRRPAGDASRRSRAGGSTRRRPLRSRPRRSRSSRTSARPTPKWISSRAAAATRSRWSVATRCSVWRTGTAAMSCV